MRWREILLGQARERIQTWYTDPSLMEAPKTRSGIAVSMMKQDMQCGGNAVPVTFAEFDVSGARPVDVFNTMLDTSAQTQWNHQCASATPLAERPEQGARGWSVVFDIPMVSNREFKQWQVVDADFVKQEFWLVFSTQNNEELQQKSQPLQGAVESQNCLGAYRITQGPNGAHVVITQHVNVHPFMSISMHQIMDLFPAAWQGTVNFVNQMGGSARQLALSGSDLTATDAPAYMLSEPPPQAQEDRAQASTLPSVAALRLVGREDVFPKIEPKAVAQARISPLQCLALVLFALSLFVCGTFAGVGTGRCALQRAETFTQLANQDTRQTHELQEDPADLEMEDSLLK